MNLLERFKPRTGHSLLGLAIQHDRLEATEIRRANGNASVRTSTVIPLESDPFAGNAETAGKALRRTLEAAGLHERRCAIVLPQDLVLSLTVPLPDLPEADQTSFLQIEAERGFPQNPDDLILQTSASATPGPSRFATLLAVPRDVVQRLEILLRAAHLRPVSITLGLPALQPAATAGPEAILSLHPIGRSLALQLTHDSAVAALRLVDEAFTGESEPLAFDPEVVLREIRITLGQLPHGIAEALRRVRIFGDSQTSRTAAESLEPRLRTLGFEVERITTFQNPDLPFRFPNGTPTSATLAAAAQTLAAQPQPLEFLPPRVSAWQQFAQRYSSRRLATTGAAAGALAAAVCLAFLLQQTLIWRWQSRWDAIKSRVAKLEDMSKEIRLYRPWFDDTHRSLSILRRLTESFPEDGSVSAKVVEIRSSGRVSCSGTARDAAAWLRMRDQLSNAQGVADVQVEQVRGKSPIEFTVHFRWEGPGGS